MKRKQKTSFNHIIIDFVFFLRFKLVGVRHTSIGYLTAEKLKELFIRMSVAYYKSMWNDYKDLY